MGQTQLPHYFKGLMSMNANKRKWREMFRSDIWIKVTKKNVAKYIPEQDNGRTYYLGVIGRDESGEFTWEMSFFDLNDAIYHLKSFNIKKFLPIHIAVQNFPDFFHVENEILKITFFTEPY